MKRHWTHLLSGLALAMMVLVAVGLLTACDIGSADSTTAVVSDSAGTIYNFSGLYMHPRNNDGTNGVVTPLVYPEGRQSGEAVTWVRLLQYGSVLEGYDNARQNWTGKISGMEGPTASFSLRGRTSAGRDVEVIGTMTYSDQQSRMDAAWLESGFSGNFFAQATVSPATTNVPSGEIRLTAIPNTVSSNNTVELRAEGGTSYTWSLSSPPHGTLAHTGNYATNVYTRTSGVATDRVIVTVTSDRRSARQTINFD